MSSKPCRLLLQLNDSWQLQELLLQHQPSQLVGRAVPEHLLTGFSLKMWRLLVHIMTCALQLAVSDLKHTQMPCLVGKSTAAATCRCCQTGNSILLHAAVWVAGCC